MSSHAKPEQFRITVISKIILKGILDVLWGRCHPTCYNRDNYENIKHGCQAV